MARPLIKTAKMRVEHYAERMLHMGKNQTGAIFALKNFGWTDSQNVNLGGQKDNPIEISDAKSTLLRGLVQDAATTGADSENQPTDGSAGSEVTA
jgi:myosin-crossreactive antigen